MRILCRPGTVRLVEPFGSVTALSCFANGPATTASLRSPASFAVQPLPLLHSPVSLADRPEHPCSGVRHSVAHPCSGARHNVARPCPVVRRMRLTLTDFVRCYTHVASRYLIYSKFYLSRALKNVSSFFSDSLTNPS